MKLRADVQCLLMDFECISNKNDSTPYLRNFLTYTEKRTEDRNIWNFLWFLNFYMKEYKKKRNLESFQEFLDNKYPPKKKTTR